MTLHAGFHHALLSDELTTPAGLRTCNGSDPAARFAVYRNNVLSSLINALADTYPVVQQLVGDTFFRAMAAIYVKSNPPTSPLLVQYGNDFPLFIETFEPAAALPYLADVARLEVLRVRAYHAADAEPVAHEALAAALGDSERLGDLIFQLHASVHVLTSAYGVRSLWAAHQGEQAIEQVVLGAAEHSLVLRQHLDVLVIGIDAECAGFITRLLGGEAFADAAACCGEDFDLGACLALLISHGAITALSYRETP